jgi:hypothetical protein
MQTVDVRLEWGHPILTPEGVEIRLPDFAFTKLSMLGLLRRDHASGLKQIRSLIYEMMSSGDYTCLMGVLKRVIGEDALGDMTGPATVDCRCPKCKRDRRQVLRDLVPDWKHLVDTKRPGLREF